MWSAFELYCALGRIGVQLIFVETVQLLADNHQLSSKDDPAQNVHSFLYLKVALSVVRDACC